MKNFTDLQTLFQQYLEQNRFTSAPDALYQPVNYILEIGGKRIRPVLLLMGYNLFKEDVEKALPASFAVELFHNFSLMHDDIMDQAPLRRGKPSVHIEYGMETGILSGDLTLILAYDYLLQYNDPQVFKGLMNVFNEVAVKVCEGQQYDMNFEKQERVELSDYLKMIEYKTAVLLSGALKMGAILGEASVHDQTMLGEFGRNVGIAFQLQDDILDSFGDPEKFGKKVGGDIAQNKKTYLLLRAMEVADNQNRMELLEVLAEQTEADSDGEKEKIKRVKGIFKRLGVLEDARAMKEKYQKEAFAALGRLTVSSEQKAALDKLARALLAREA